MDMTNLGWTQAVDFPDLSITLLTFVSQGLETEGSPFLTYTQVSYPNLVYYEDKQELLF